MLAHGMKLNPIHPRVVLGEFPDRFLVVLRVPEQHLAVGHTSSQNVVVRIVAGLRPGAVVFGVHRIFVLNFVGAAVQRRGGVGRAKAETL